MITSHEDTQELLSAAINRFEELQDVHINSVILLYLHYLQLFY